MEMELIEPAPYSPPPSLPTMEALIESGLRLLAQTLDIADGDDGGLRREEIEVVVGGLLGRIGAECE